MEVLRQIKIGAVRYKKGDRLDHVPKTISDECIKKLIESGYIRVVVLEPSKEKKGGK